MKFPSCAPSYARDASLPSQAVAAISRSAAVSSRQTRLPRAKIARAGPAIDSSNGGSAAGAGGLKGSSRFISFGEFQLDCERGVLQRAGECVDLRPKPLALLVYLAQHRTRAVPKRELLQQLWPDVFVSEMALASALKDLRRSIGDDGIRQKVVKTLRRRGYRFAAQVRDQANAPTAPRGLARPRAAERPETPIFVGRAPELAWLMERLADAAAGRPRVVLVVGEAGIGKSSLVEQLQREPECEDFEVVTGRCQVQASLPYLPFVEALRQWLLQNDESLDSPARRRAGRDSPAPAARLRHGRPAAECGDLERRAKARGAVLRHLPRLREARAAAPDRAGDRGSALRRLRVARPAAPLRRRDVRFPKHGPASASGGRDAAPSGIRRPARASRRGPGARVDLRSPGPLGARRRRRPRAGREPGRRGSASAGGPADHRGHARKSALRARAHPRRRAAAPQASRGQARRRRERGPSVGSRAREARRRARLADRPTAGANPVGPRPSPR